MNKAIMLLLGGDLAAAVIAYAAGAFLRARLPEMTELPVQQEILALCGFILVLGISGLFSELYTRGPAVRSRELIVRVGATVVLSAILLVVMGVLIPPLHIAFGALPLFSLPLFGVMQFGWHHNFHHLLRAPGIAQKVLILGGGPVAEQIQKILTANQHNYILAGLVPTSGGGPEPAAIQAEPGETLIRTAIREKVDKIVISLTERRGVLPMRDILGCKLSGIEIVDAMSFYEQMTGKLMVEKITPSWFIFSNGSRVTPFMRFSKRICDVALAGAGLFLLAPLLPLLALAVKLDSPGPVLFRQVRVGRGERNFVLFKFRTMRNDAERLTGAVWAVENDPRVTRVGRILRKTRLDEIPQLLNVLAGDMSLVGPRPERPEFVEQLKEQIPFYSNRHYVKPGVTGWAQVNYSYGASMEDSLEKLRYDLYYIKNYSLALDFLIILETVKVVLFGRGAR